MLASKRLCNRQFCWYEDDSAIISALTPELHDLHHVLRPDKKGDGVGCLIRQLQCEIVSRTKTTYYKKKLNECEKYSSKTYVQLNILLGKNKNSNIIPSGKLPLPLANGFRTFLIDKFDKRNT